jgi:hypothetical protein
VTRPRIRTLKPENWHDEAVRRCSRDARLLRDVLLTFADDDGRWHHMPVAIMGHGYPEDDDVPPAKINRWTQELVASGLVVLYEVDGSTYGCFPRWHLHQNINRYTPSDLPPCPDLRVLTRDEAAVMKRTPRTESAPTSQGGLTESSVSTHPEVDECASPHAQARGSGSTSTSTPAVSSTDASARDIAATVAEVEAILAQAPRLKVVRVGIENAIASHPGGDPVAAARECVAWSSDPAFRKTNGASLLIDVLRKQKQPKPWPSDDAAGFKPRRNGGQPYYSAEDYLNADVGDAA